MTVFEERLIDVLIGIRGALDALVMLQVPDESEAPAGCAHDWVSLGEERECRKCRTREQT